MFHKRLLSQFKENRKLIAGMVFAQWGSLTANVILMLVSAEFVSAVFLGNDLAKRAHALLLALLFAMILRSFLSYLNQKWSFETSKQLKEKLRMLIYEKLMKLGSSSRDCAKTSEIVQFSTEGVEQLEIYFGKYMPQFFYSMLAPLTLFAITGTMSLKVALVLLLCVPLIPASIIAVQKFAKRMLARYWGTYTQLGDSFLECLQGLTTLKIYQADERYAKKMEEESEEFRKVTMRVLIMQLNSISIMDIVAYGGAGIGIILSILELQGGKITLAQCFFLVMISAEFFLPLRLLGSFFHIAMNGNAAADKIFRFLDETEPEQGDRKDLKTENCVSFEGVSFCYEEEVPVLKNINFQAKRGMNAFVGESGCGKSTVVSLIMGENIPQQGKIKIGAAELSGIHPDALYQKITRISHDSYLFAGTVRENLRMGRKNASEEEMQHALEQVQLLDFIQKNGGLDMELLEKASNLSGGQRQRLAIARALLHDSGIYIFDEAASNVDAESENAIMSAVKELARKKTVLLISHRLFNVVNADRIFVLKNGEVIESGSHEKLCQKKGYYHTLYTQQMKLEQYAKGGAGHE